MAAATQWTLSAFSLAKPLINQVHAYVRNSWKDYRGAKVVKASSVTDRGGAKGSKDVPVTFLPKEDTSAEPDGGVSWVYHLHLIREDG